MCLALMDAGVPMKEMFCACSTGLVSDTVCRDLNQQEEGGGRSSLPLCIGARSEEVLFLQLNRRVSVEKLELLLGEATDGCREVRSYIESAMSVAMKKSLTERECVDT